MRATMDEIAFDSHKQNFSFTYRDQFKPEKFKTILDAYMLFLPLLFQKFGLNQHAVRLVGRGMSGTVFVMPLAAALGCHATIVRKPDENSHGQRVEGVTDLHMPWIFIDDCIDTGATFDACKEELGGKDPVAAVLWGCWHVDEPHHYALTKHIDMRCYDEATA